MPLDISPNPENRGEDPEFPTAIPQQATIPKIPGASLTFWRSWWLTLACSCLAIALMVWSWLSRGPIINIRFREGHGLKVESRLMHRGIEVGMVEQIELTSSLDFVDVHVRLVPSARALAREGSLFWIERPSLSFGGVRGLETIVSGRYVAVEPGPTGNPPQHVFQGLEQARAHQATPGGLEIVLDASSLHGLQTNAPIVYRGLKVGYVQSVGLSADSRWVQVRALIEADYRQLVRENSRFWNRSGFRIDVGLSGVEIDAESFAGIAAGGLEFATPDPPGEPVKAGRRFELAPQADEAWTQWRPRLLYGNHALTQWENLPVQERLSLTWQEPLFGFRRQASRSGWVLVLDDKSVIGPSDLFDQPAAAIDGTLRWELAGQQFDASQIEAVISQGSAHEPHNSLSGSKPVASTARYRFQTLGTSVAPFPVKRLGTWVIPSEPPPSPSTIPSSYPLWIVGDVPSRWLPLEWYQIQGDPDGPWQLDLSLGIGEDYHGAAVLDGRTGNIIGMVNARQIQASIVPIQAR